MPTPSELRDHLVTSRLAGDVATTPGATLDNCRKLLSGDPRYTFGLSDWADADEDEVVGAVAKLCGPAAVDRPTEGPGWIDPDATVSAAELHRDRLHTAAGAGERVLLATGHPTGLLLHYAAVARRLRAAGCTVLQPLAEDLEVVSIRGRWRGLRYLGGVACVWTGGDLAHSHRAAFMEAMLDHLGDAPPTLVIGDHGMAGAAVERGIDALSIADVNDPALPLAQARGRTDGVLPVDDNLPPERFEPLTAAVLEGLRS